MTRAERMAIRGGDTPLLLRRDGVSKFKGVSGCSDGFDALVF